MAVGSVAGSQYSSWYSPNLRLSGALGKTVPYLSGKPSFAAQPNTETPRFVQPPNTEAPKFVQPPNTSRPAFVPMPVTYRPQFVPSPSTSRPSFVPASVPAATFGPAPAAPQTLNFGSNITFDGDEQSRPAGPDSASRPGAYAGCQTCQNRTYVDGSNEGDVSFKTPGHIAPEASAATVMSHEREHVSNAYQEADRSGGKVLSATVQLKSSICPECHRSYISGGTTRTVVSTPVQAYKPQISNIGGNFDMAS